MMMKQLKLMMIALMAIVAMGAQAQELKPFRIGITGGVNLSSISVDYKHSMRVGYNVGVVAELSPVKFFYVNASAVLTQKGVVFEKFGQLTTGNKKTTVDIEATPCYLQFAPHAGVRAFINKSGGTPLSIFAEFGPYYATGIAGSLKDKEHKGDNKFKYFSDESKEFFGSHMKPNKTDYGLTGAVGVEIANVCKLGFTYDYGLAKAYELDSGWTWPDFENGKTRNFTMQISVMF